MGRIIFSAEDKKAFDLIADISTTAIKDAKIAILSQAYSNERFKYYMRVVYSPYIKTNVGRKSLKRLTPFVAEDIEFIDLVEHLTVCNPATGELRAVLQAAYDAEGLNTSVSKYKSNVYRSVVLGIMTCDLKLGISLATLNKVYGKDFIPTGGCMLGTLLSSVLPKYKRGAFSITEKLDGHRKVILVPRVGNIEIYSGRNWKLDTNYPDIIAEAEKLPKGYAYDGEMIAIGNFNDSIAQRQATSSICNSKSNNKTGVAFNVFDMINIEHLYKGFDDTNCIYRKMRLAMLFNDKKSVDMLQQITGKIDDNVRNYWQELADKIKDFNYIKVVNILGIVNGDITDEIVHKFVTPIWKRGGEGIMFNDLMAPYEVKRTKTLLKVKKTLELDLKIIDWEYGKLGTANEHRCGSLVVSYKGNRVNVGSGLSDYMREDIVENFEANYLGKIATVATFGESTNKDGTISLNSPVFIEIRTDKEEADF